MEDCSRSRKEKLRDNRTQPHTCNIKTLIVEIVNAEEPTIQDDVDSDHILSRAYGN